MHLAIGLLALFLPIAALAALVVLFIKYRSLRKRYGAIADVDAALDKAKQSAAQLAAEYRTAKATYDQLRAEIALLEENVDDISFGLYRPHFDFKTSDEYRAKLEEARSEMKALVRSGRAAVCASSWHINGSKRDGARMQKQYMKLMLRAFNGECDAAVAKVAWNNVTKMEDRIGKAFTAINELGSVMSISITPVYLECRLRELQLEHELAEKRQEEIEEQRRIKQQMREEERVQRELERAREEAEDDEKRYQRALEKARAEATAATGEQMRVLTERAAALEIELHEARERKARAISRAQMTRSGYVYIVSNIGSFGENVFKIGMTRRLEPLDRIKELGDASVPFDFDVHAMAFSEDAPALENDMHRHFSAKRVNMVNQRKEFFRVTIEDLEGYATKRGIRVELTKLAEAKEYRETIALAAPKASPAESSAFPDDVRVSSAG